MRVNGKFKPHIRQYIAGNYYWRRNYRHFAFKEQQHVAQNFYDENDWKLLEELKEQYVDIHRFGLKNPKELL